MKKVVEFLQKNVTEKQNAVRLCSVLSRMESFGSVQTTRRMSIRICLRIRKLRYRFRLLSMHGFVFMAKQSLRTT